MQQCLGTTVNDKREHGGRRDNHKRRPDDKRGGKRPGAGRPKKMIKHITSYLSQSGDIEVSVTLIAPDTYAVRIHDVDVGETLPASRRFPTEAAAKAYALQCASSGDTDELPV